jgi:hypothetical protein
LFRGKPRPEQIVLGDQQKKFRDHLKTKLCARTQLEFSPKQLDSFFNPCNEPELLKIQEISRQSPLEVVYIGCPLLITLAVIFSGGKISLKVIGTGIDAELKSLGEGIKSLKKALGLGKRLNAGYGIRVRS